MQCIQQTHLDLYDISCNRDGSLHQPVGPWPVHLCWASRNFDCASKISPKCKLTAGPLHLVTISIFPFLCMIFGCSNNLLACLHFLLNTQLLLHVDLTATCMIYFCACGKLQQHLFAKCICYLNSNLRFHQITEYIFAMHSCAATL